MLISEHNERYVAGHLFLGITGLLSMTFLIAKVCFYYTYLLHWDGHSLVYSVNNHYTQNINKCNPLQLRFYQQINWFLAF